MSKIIIRSIATGEAVHEIDTTNLSESQRERAFMGVARQADLERHYIDEVDS